jgi:hypothetical protein
MDMTGKLLILSNALLFLTWAVWMWRNTPKQVKREKLKKSYFNRIEDTKNKTSSGYVWE